MPAQLTPPLIILGCHRSGTSAITGLLHEGAGLFLGDVLPPTKENPKGYYESTGVVAAHRNILRELGRDWTCPPTTIDRTSPASRALGQALEVFELDDSTKWGVKDPRVLFLLPAWLDHVPGMQFVGVIRNPGSIAKSIIKRDDLPEEFAHDLVAAYIERLADLHRRFEFPIIDFGDEDAAVLARTQAVAEAAGMPWDDESARKFFTPSLIHHKSTQSPDPNYHYLLEQAARPVGELKTYDAETIGEALSDLTSERATLLPTSYGLRFKERRRALWNEILHDPDLESVIDLVPGLADKTFLNPKDLEFVTLATVGTGASVPRQLKASVPATHVLATGVITSLAPDDFNKLLIDLDQKTQIEATAIFDGLEAGTSPSDWETAVRNTAWTVDEVRAGPHGDVLVLYKSAATVDRDREPTTTERHLLNLDARLTALERTASARRETYAKQKAASATDEAAELRAKLDEAERALAAANTRYERLANRRAVKVALKTAAPASGLFRWRRRKP